MRVNTRSFRLEDEREPDRVVRGRIDAPDGAGPFPFVLVLHGFKGFMDWGFFPELTRRLAGAGMVAIRFNMSGSGVGDDLGTFSDEEGFARNTCTRELEDTARVRAFVDAGGVPEADVARAGLFGHSLGGGIALLHANERAERGAYRGIVTWAAVARLERFDEATLARWRRDGRLFVHNARTGQDHRLDLGWLADLEANGARFDVPVACARSRTPTLLVHGTADEAVPFAEGQTLAAALAPDVGRLLGIEGAGHTFGATHPLRGVHGDLARAFDATLAHFTRSLAI